MTFDSCVVSQAGKLAHSPVPHPHIRRTDKTTQMSLIFDYLVLGSSTEALDLEYLKNSKITHILNMAFECENHFPDQFKYLKISAEDTNKYKISDHFNAACDFIQAAKAEPNGRVFVHCSCGISRSPTIVIAHMMRDLGWKLDQALKFVEEKRNFIKINWGFEKQLNKYYK